MWQQSLHLKWEELFPKPRPQSNWQSSSPVWLFFSTLRPFSSALHSVIGSSLSFSLTPFTLAVPSLQTPVIFFLSTLYSPRSQRRGSSSEERLDRIPYFDVSNCLLLLWMWEFCQTMWVQVCEGRVVMFGLAHVER